MTILRALFSSAALLLARLAVAAVLIYAGFGKLPNPWVFAETIGNFRMLPAQGGQLLAVILPWCEITTGLLLLCGLWLRAAGLLALLLFCAFNAAIITALARGLDTECGCFGTGSRADWHTLALDLAGALAALVILRLAGKTRKGLTIGR